MLIPLPQDVETDGFFPTQHLGRNDTAMLRPCLLRPSLLLTMCALVSAQFRGGSISWERVSPEKNAVRFTVRRLSQRPALPLMMSTWQCCIAALCLQCSGRGPTAPLTH